LEELPEFEAGFFLLLLLPPANKGGTIGVLPLMLTVVSCALEPGEARGTIAETEEPDMAHEIIIINWPSKIKTTTRS